MTNSQATSLCNDNNISYKEILDVPVGYFVLQYLNFKTETCLYYKTELPTEEYIEERRKEMVLFSIEYIKSLKA